jgi:hypothetical protein
VVGVVVDYLEDPKEAKISKRRNQIKIHSYPWELCNERKRSLLEEGLLVQFLVMSL